MEQPGRKYNNNNLYRYGFQTQEKSKEINENLYSARYWEYDARIGRRWNLDPKSDISISPYNCFSGNPIRNTDFLGDTTKMKGDIDMAQEFVNLLQERTGNTYKIDADRNLIRTNKNDAKIEKGTQSKLLGGIVDYAIDNSKVMELDFTSKNDKRNDEVFIDHLPTKLVDVGDINRIKSEALQTALIGHVFSERVVSQYRYDFSNIGVLKKNFPRFHNYAIFQESKIFSEMTGLTFQKRTEKIRDEGYSTKISFIYGERKFTVYVLTNKYTGRPTGRFLSDFHEE